MLFSLLLPLLGIFMPGFSAEVPCLDPLACNFMEEGECFFNDENGDPCVIEGCTIEGACNYDPAADIYDGSCEFVSCLGCTDSEACNYDETALYDDATCIYYVDCNGTCGGDWIEDACGNCYSLIGSLTPGANIESAIIEYTGSPYYWSVPEGVFSLFVELYGAQGGHGGPESGGIGGLGGYVSAVIEVIPGTEIQINVGGKGEDFVLSSYSGGFNGGGGTDAYSDDNARPGCGGGATDIRIEGTSLSHRILIAGGGGGAGGWMGNNGGAGGGLAGQDGQMPYFGDNPVYSGQGGTQSVGGIGGYDVAENGSLGIGGRGKGQGHGGGGGGGGYYGGGGGLIDAGGGGSSFVGDLQNAVTETGIREGDGLAVLTYNIIPTCNPGCTYPQACNYNPESNFDDGSCDYCFCGEGTQWVDSLQACIVTEAALMQACGEGTYWDDLAQACLTIETCQEDLDGDGVIGVEDLLQLLSSFGMECALEPETSEFTCGDPLNYHGYDYATVQIGEQCWFAENLRNQQYANGDSIPGNLSDEEWSSTALTSLGAQAIYFEDPLMLMAYGRLYNWYAAVDSRNLCPQGWHVPSDGEFLALEVTLGITIGDGLNDTGWRGTDQGHQLKSSPVDGPAWDGSNVTGFSALPGGGRLGDGQYYSQGSQYYADCSLWTSTASPQGHDAWYRGLNASNSGIWRGITANGQWQQAGMSVRCIKD